MKNLITIFKLNWWKRLFILIFTISCVILIMIFGSVFYVSKNSYKSIEYGGGAEYLVKINTDSQKEEDAKLIASDVAQEIYERINPSGNNGVSVNKEIRNNESLIRILYPATLNKNQKNEIENLIISKPKLIFTDVFGNPLFNEYGKFREELKKVKGFQSSSNIYLKYNDPNGKISKPPIKKRSAKRTVSQEGKIGVRIDLKDKKINEWAKTTEYIKSLKDLKANYIITWLNLPEFMYLAPKKSLNNWKKADGNPVRAAHVDGDWNKMLSEKTIDSKKYKISQAEVEKTLYYPSFVIEGSMSENEAIDLSRKINYGTSDYSLTKEYSNYIKPEYGINAFQKSIFAGIIVFCLIFLFLALNYGILGFISTLSIGFYVFLTLTCFSLMKGEFSPEAIAALIIGIGMAIDVNIITFERLKNEIYLGVKLKKANQISNQKSLSSIIDANMTTLIVAFVLFFFGTRGIIGLSVTLILSIFLIFLIMMGFTKFLTKLLINTGIFNNKMHWLGLKPKFDNQIQSKINKIDYIKNAKWFSLSSLIIFLISFIFFIIMIILGKSFNSGFNLSKEFQGGTILQISNEITVGSKKHLFAIDSVTKQNIQKFLLENNILEKDIQWEDIFNNKTPNELTSFKIAFSKKIDFNNLILNFKKTFPNLNIYFSNISTYAAKELVKNAFTSILIAIFFVVLYTLIRFKWTYSISAIFALFHDALIILSFFVLFRIEISPVFIAGILSIMGYSINDTIIIFDKIRNNVKAHDGLMNKKTIKEIANKSIKETIKRSFWTSFTTILSVVVLMSFGNATKMSFNLVMFIGIIAGTYSSIFIATYIWTKLELLRQKWALKREKNKFWNVNELEEQIFKGINDYNV